MFLFFDPFYMLFVALPTMLLAGWASLKVKRAMSQAARIAPSSRMTGAEAAQRVLAANNLQNVRIEPTRGYLGDHYDPRNKVLRLTPDVYGGRNLTAVGVAAHEAGHAIQDAHHYGPLKLRNGLVPMAGIGSNFGFIVVIAGIIFSAKPLISIGIALFAITVVFQLINLPVEFNASSRAREVLVENGIVARSELEPVGKVLNAAAMTYVAATIGAILTLLWLLMRSGLLGGRN
jgi:Zn-dependent membrane protease YugP